MEKLNFQNCLIHKKVYDLIKAPKNWLSYNKLLLVSGQYSSMILLASEGTWIHDNIGSFLSITADSNLVAKVIVFAEIWMKKLYLQPRCRLHSVWSVSREQSSSLARMWSTREPPTHLGYDSSSPPNPWKRCGTQSGWSGLVWFLLCHKTSHTCHHTYIPLILKQKHTEWITEKNCTSPFFYVCSQTPSAAASCKADSIAMALN